MTTQNMEHQSTEEAKAIERRNRKHTNNILGGIIIVGVGTVLLAKRAGADFPEWFFTWQMLVIVLGIYSGVKHRFRDWSWIGIIAVGVVFLMKDYVEGFSMYYAWPALLILVGLCMIVYPTKKDKCFN